MKKHRTDIGLLIFRVSFALMMMLFFGWGKLAHLLSGEEIQFGDPIGIGEEASFVLAMVAEFFAALFILLGFKTRWAAAILTINMFVAAIIQLHGMDFSQPNRLFALLFLMAFTTIFFTGGGRFSMDYLIESRALTKRKESA